MRGCGSRHSFRLTASKRASSHMSSGDTQPARLRGTRRSRRSTSIAAAAVAGDVGIEGPVLDGGDLPRDSAALRRLLAEHAVIGRISPADKKRVVETLAADGGYVAMVGDGVNDVPALKSARLAIAQGNGS